MIQRLDPLVGDVVGEEPLPFRPVATEMLTFAESSEHIRPLVLLSARVGVPVWAFFGGAGELPPGFSREGGSLPLSLCAASWR